MRRAGVRPWAGLLAGVGIAFATSPPAASAQDSAIGPSGNAALLGVDLPVVERTLENGMRLLVLPRPGAPTVSLVVRYGVGGVNERPGETGIAHLLEHLLFKGSTRIGTRDWSAERPLLETTDVLHDSLVTELEAVRPDSVRIARLMGGIAALEDSARTFVVANEFDRILSRWGARGLNATTSNEETMYFVELPANRLEQWFALEAERMRDPVFREFHTERDVVTEERRLRVDTSPGGLLYEVHLEAAWQRHPYRQPVVGTMHDLDRLTRPEVAEYYRRFYGARNAVVAVVGAVDAEAVVGMAEEWFGPVRRGEPVQEPDFDEPPRSGPVHVEVEWDAEPSLRIGWPIPPGDHEDTPALVLLLSLLTGGRTAILQQEMVQGSRSVTGVLGSLGPGERFERLFTLDASPRSPTSPEAVEAEILDHVARVAREGVDPEALQRVRNQISAGDVRRLRSNMGLAFQLASSAGTYGDWRETFRFADRMRRVTPEDIRAAAERWLRPETRVVATLRRTDEGGDR